jgi:uncharacterized protein (DUF305 family)
MKYITQLAVAIAAVALPVLAIAQDDATAVKDAFKRANDAMMQDMHKPASGNADKDFVMMMIPHHQGAIDMAKIELQYGKDEKLKTMAEEIIAAQEKEINELRTWLAANP